MRDHPICIYNQWGSVHDSQIASFIVRLQGLNIFNTLNDFDCMQNHNPIGSHGFGDVKRDQQ